MQTERPAFLALMLILSFFGPVLLRHSVHVTPKAFFPRRPDSSATRKASSSSSSSRPTSSVVHVTRVQLEDLDEAATSADCLRLRQLDLCDRGRPRRLYSALSYSSSAESNWRPAQTRTLFSLLDRSPSSCRRFLRPFLCVSLAPNCSFSEGNEVPAALPPCRTMCLAAAEGCRGVLGARGIDWPAEWTCEQFPVDGLCLTQPPRHGTGLRADPNGGPALETFAVESRGSLQPPPPSSAFDSDLLAPWPDGEDARFFRGWADVQGLGRANDYCRISGTDSRNRILSCAINGTEGGDRQVLFASKRGFDPGLPRTGFMRDVDADKRDDYCRCVGNSERSQLICMKAGERGFYGGTLQPGSQYTIRIQAHAYANYCHRRNNDAFH